MAQTMIGGELFETREDGPADAPALLLSNSLGTNLAMWDPQIAAFAKSFRVLRYDSRGHGKSAAPDRPYSIAELARDALGVLDHFGVAKAHFLGLSKGGMVGQWLAAHHGDRIDRAIFANTASIMPPPSGWNQRIMTARERGMEPLVEPVIARWFTPEFVASDPRAVERIAAMLRATPPLGYAGCCAAIRDMDQRHSITGIKVPTLVIVGSRDPATPPEQGELMAATIPGAKLARLQAAHLSNIEAEAEFTKAVLAFLSASDAKRS